DSLGRGQALLQAGGDDGEAAARSRARLTAASWVTTSLQSRPSSMRRMTPPIWAWARRRRLIALKRITPVPRVFTGGPRGRRGARAAAGASPTLDSALTAPGRGGVATRLWWPRCCDVVTP